MLRRSGTCRRIGLLRRRRTGESRRQDRLRLFLMDRKRLGMVAALGTAHTLAWGSSYYLPAILAAPIAKDLGISSNWFLRGVLGVARHLWTARPPCRSADRPRRRAPGALRLERAAGGSRAARRVDVALEHVGGLGTAGHGPRPLAGANAVGLSRRRSSSICAKRDVKRRSILFTTCCGNLISSIGHSVSSRQDS